MQPGAILMNLLTQTEHAELVLGAENSLQIEQFDHEPVFQHLDRLLREDQVGGVAEGTVATVTCMTAVAVPIVEATGTVGVETWKNIWVSK